MCSLLSALVPGLFGHWPPGDAVGTREQETARFRNGIARLSHRRGPLCLEGGVPVTALEGRTLWQEGAGISQWGGHLSVGRVYYTLPGFSFAKTVREVGAPGLNMSTSLSYTVLSEGASWKRIGLWEKS